MLSDPPLVALHEVIQSVARQTDLRATLSLVAEKTRALTGAASAAVTLLDKNRVLLDFVAVAGANAAEIVGQTVRVEDALAGQTALTGELYLAHNTAETQPLLATHDPAPALGWGVRSAAVVPIYVAGRPAGALAAINREDGGAFGGDDILRLQTLANVAALSLGMDNLRREAKQKQRERDILFHAARTTSSSLNVQEVLSSVLATVEESMDMVAGAVYLLNDERTRLYISADRGLAGDDRERQLVADTGQAAQVLAGPGALRLAEAPPPDAPDDPLLPGMRSVLAAPMLSRATPEGLIVVGSRQPDAYTPEDAALLSAVASQAAVALENAWLYEDAMRRAQEATALYELSQAVGATLSLGRMLNFVADSVLGLLHVDKFALFLLDPRADVLEIKIARNIRREVVQGMKPRPGQGIAGWVLEFETPTAVQDVAADHRNRSCPIDGEGVTSLVSVPLQSGDQVIGVLHAMSSRRRLFTVGEMELLYTIANQVGAAIVNAQMYEEARQKTDEIRKYVRRVARALGSSLDAQGTAQVIADLAAEMAGADRSILFAADGQGRLTARAACNFKGALGSEASASDGETPAAWIVRRGRSLMIEDLTRDRFVLPAFAARERVGGYLGVPLRLGKEVLGVLEVYARDSRRFTSDEMRLLITFASQATVALQNAFLVEQAGRRRADLQVLGVLSEHLGRPWEAVPLLQEALPLLGAALRAEAGAAVLFDRAESPILFRREGVAEDVAQALATAGLDGAGGPDHLAVPLAPAPQGDARGALLFRRRQPFDTHDRQLVATAANLLALRLF